MYLTGVFVAIPVLLAAVGAIGNSPFLGALLGRLAAYVVDPVALFMFLAAGALRFSIAAWLGVTFLAAVFLALTGAPIGYAVWAAVTGVSVCTLLFDIFPSKNG